jgi:hypothetical protein
MIYQTSWLLPALAMVKESISKVWTDPAIYNDSHQAARLSAYNVSTGGFKLPFK